MILLCEKCCIYVICVIRVIIHVFCVVYFVIKPSQNDTTHVQNYYLYQLRMYYDHAGQCCIYFVIVWYVCYVICVICVIIHVFCACISSSNHHKKYRNNYFCEIPTCHDHSSSVSIMWCKNILMFDCFSTITCENNVWNIDKYLSRK